MVKKITETKIISLYSHGYNKVYYLREMAMLLSKPHQTIKPYLESLVQKKILQKHKRKNVVDYRLNLTNPQSFDMVMMAEKEKLINKLDEDNLLEMLYEKISPYFKRNTFIVFGSAVDNVKKASDIDLLIVGSKLINLEEFEEVYNKKIHVITVKSLSKLSKVLSIEIYRRHLICNNTEAVINHFRDLHEKNKLV